MNDSIVLFVLGNLFLKDADDGKTLPPESCYSHEAANGEFPGIQANEAPVEFLIKVGNDSGQPIVRMLYLCSEKCLAPNIPAKLAEESIVGFSTTADAISTEEFFLARIEAYCKTNGYVIPKPMAIPFNPLRPADSLDDLVNHLDTGSRVSIDITGGPRDAVILLSLTAQIIKFGSGGTTFGDILYTNFNERVIHRQNNSFDLIDLVNAIGSFTDYGRADRLKVFFDGNPYIKEPTRQLCRSIEAFSDSLALCQIDSIGDRVLEVQKCLEIAEDNSEKLKSRYKLYTDAIEQINESSPIRSKSFEQSLEEIGELHPDISFSELSKDELLDTLIRLRKPTMLNRAELLFLSLIPTIRDKFIKATNTNSALIIETIKWCNDRQMAQQALGIFREHIPQCMVEEGFISPNVEVEKPELWPKVLSNVFEEKGKYVDIAKIDRDIAQHLREMGLVLIDDNARDGLRQVFLLKNPSRYAKRSYFTVDVSRNKQLSMILVWFRYIWLVRNFTMHVTEPNDKFLEFMKLFNNIYGEKRYSNRYALSDIQHDIDLALSSFAPSSAERFDESEWEAIIERIAGRATTIPVADFDCLVEGLRKKASSEQPYIFENDIPDIADVSKSELVETIATDSNAFDMAICVRIADTADNESRWAAIARNGDIRKMSWTDPWEQLKDKIVAFGHRSHREFVVWDAFRSSNSLPGKTSFGFAKSARIDGLFPKLSRTFPADFPLSPCLKCVKPASTDGLQADSDKLRGAKDTAQSKSNPAGSKERKAKKEARRGLGSDLSSRLDPETIAKLKKIGE